MRTIGREILESGNRNPNRYCLLLDWHAAGGDDDGGGGCVGDHLSDPPRIDYDLPVHSLQFVASVADSAEGDCCYC